MQAIGLRRITEDVSILKEMSSSTSGTLELLALLARPGEAEKLLMKIKEIAEPAEQYLRDAIARAEGLSEREKKLVEDRDQLDMAIVAFQQQSKAADIEFSVRGTEFREKVVQFDKSSMERMQQLDDRELEISNKETVQDELEEGLRTREQAVQFREESIAEKELAVEKLKAEYEAMIAKFRAMIPPEPALV